MIRRLLSPLGYVLVALCFLLPFVTVRYASETFRSAVTWYGVDLIVGGEPRLHLEELAWDEHLQRDTMQDVTAVLTPYVRGSLTRPPFVPGQPVVIVAILLVLLGILAVVPAGLRARTVLAAVAGLAGAAVLTAGEWLALLPIGRLFANGDPPADPRFGYGYWCSIGLLLVLGTGNAVAAYRMRGAQGTSTARPVT